MGVRSRILLTAISWLFLHTAKTSAALFQCFGLLVVAPGDTLAPWAWRSCFARQPAGQRRGGLARQEPRGGGGLLSNWVEAVLLDAGFEADDITEVTPILLKQKVIGAALLQLTLEELMQDGVPRGLP
ncbi:unnamed protein product [Effrenium voratum]|uniref:Uncharacterized protein n=1 Tax=Effrenium voratum TaxID=2562239 RepID=A0AA36HW75_9DINO|nr:unnamed protein product [Effrenium voratum]